MKRKLFLDVDGCLCNWVKGAHEIHGVDYDSEEWPYVKGPDGWDFYKDPRFNVAFEHLFDGMDRTFWANLEWMPDGKEILSLCEEYFGDDICLLTAPHHGDGVVDGRLDWIEHNMPNYRKRTLVGSCKEVIAAVGGPNAILVDDWDRNIDNWGKAGGTAIHCPRPWNSLHAFSAAAVPFLESILYHHSTCIHN